MCMMSQRQNRLVLFRIAKKVLVHKYPSIALFRDLSAF